MGKSRGKTNHRKGGGGGGARYAASADEIEARDAREAVANEESARRRQKRIAEASGAAIESGSEEEEDGLFDREVEEKLAESRASGKPKGIKTANPNDVQPRFTKIKDMGRAAAASEGDAAASPAAEPRMSRRDREAAEAQRKKEAYQKLHAEGKTDEYKRDMERLKLARARREEAAAAAAAEKEREQAAQAAIKAAAAAEAEAGDADGPPKLDARAVKKMNGKQLKEHLKEYGQPTHGQKKELMQRLLDVAT